MTNENTTRYSWRLLRAGEFRLDGGSMFGLIPRSVWSRSVVADDKGRIIVQHNCLLLEGGGKRILLEVGTGDKLDQKSKDLFVMQDRTIMTALHEVNCRCEDIDGVLTTHLHFDHAGGLTRLAKPGEQPDWHGVACGMVGSGRPDQGIKHTFPNAKVFTQAREWADAVANKSVMTRTYFADHLEPLRERVTLLDSPRPFASGYIPDRDEMPLLPLSLRETPVPGFPGLSVFLTPGHTWGQQAMKFTDTTGTTVVFVPDVFPTCAHLGQAYSMAYDVEPYTSCVTKRWLLEAAAEENWLLILDHEAGNPCQRVKKNDKGWFDLQAVETVGV